VRWYERFMAANSTPGSRRKSGPHLPPTITFVVCGDSPLPRQQTFWRVAKLTLLGRSHRTAASVNSGDTTRIDQRSGPIIFSKVTRRRKECYLRGRRIPLLFDVWALGGKSPTSAAARYHSCSTCGFSSRAHCWNARRQPSFSRRCRHLVPKTNKA
jgi:hypothetical protein